MKILGISAFYHDSAACVIEDGEILCAAQEERFTRKKHDPSFPTNAVKYCLEHCGASLKEIDAVVFYDKPWLKFERLLETYYVHAPKGVQSFITAMPVWIKEKLFLKTLILNELTAIEPLDKTNIKLLFSEHHLSHAASAFYPSPYNNAAILTIDGVGEWATASISHGRGRQIRMLKELQFPHSLGLLYSAFTYYLGFKVNSGEYKLMGLSPYGNPGSSEVERYYKLITGNMANIKNDGSIFLNQEYFDYAAGLTMTNNAKWKELFGFSKRKPETELAQHHCDLALAIQKLTEDIVIKMGKTAKLLTGEKNMVLAGGVALNCVSNKRLLDSGVFDNIWIQPAAGDAGGALGAAYAAYHLYFERDRQPAVNGTDAMKGSYLGPEFDGRDIEAAAKKFKAVFKRYGKFDELCADVSKHLANGFVAGWFQGRMEWGPRSLGNRSIIGDARNAEMQKRMNLKIKYRESFRPFAPSVLKEDASEYFKSDVPSPYMLLIDSLKDSLRNKLPADYDSLSIKDKLYFKRSGLPAITHLDFSARLQTVDKATNPRFWGLIDAFKKLTGCSMIVNTSFNVRGEPIVRAPEDAYRCFMRTEMDCLVMGDYLFLKTEQPAWKEKVNWKLDLVLD